jgi:hypothetical protein
MQGALLAWWLALCAAAFVNVLAWAWSARRLARGAANMPVEVLALRRSLLWLSAGYAAGCAFRSLLPMVDVPRICLHDNWISRIVVGRSIATVAELCFAAQWALLLREADTRPTAFASRLIVPLIVAAELFSWSAVATSNYLLHAFENSLWTLAAALAIAGFVPLWQRADGATARFAGAAVVSGAVYVAFMVTVDVPMYLTRWAAAGDRGPPLAEGLQTLIARCVVEHDWPAWREDALWLSLYFTVGVWVSIALAHAPRLRSSGAR